MALIIITGPPCSGKTSLSMLLSQRYAIPAFGKDMIKESLADTLNGEDRPGSRALGIAAEELLYVIADALLHSGGSVILEGTFKDPHARGPLADLIARHAAAAVQIQCITRPDLLPERYRNREGRHSVHSAADGGPGFEEDMRRGRYAPIEIPGAIVTLETSDYSAVDYSEVYAAIDCALAR